MAGPTSRLSVREVIEMVCLPDGALSDTESTADDELTIQILILKHTSLTPALMMMSHWQQQQELIPTTLMLKFITYMQTVTLTSQMTMNLSQAQLQSTKSFLGGRGNPQQLT